MHGLLKPLAIVVLCAVLGVAALACVAPGEGARQVTVAISCDDFQQSAQQARSVTVARDGTVTVTLCSNPSTGFKWEHGAISDPAVLSQRDYQFLPPQSATPLAGAAGQEQWLFDANASGTATVDFHYSQSWTGGSKGAWSLALTVTVSP